MSRKPTPKSATSKRTGAQISYLLRHATIDELPLDRDGWAWCHDIRNKMNITPDILSEIVKSDDKRRYEFSECGLRIRAVQGHSSDQVRLTFPEAVPPEELYHGTADVNAPSIKKSGILPGSRHYVHLSADLGVAIQVGGRHGKPIVYCIPTQPLIEAGHKFYQAKNGVWLIDFIPPEFL